MLLLLIWNAIHFHQKQTTHNRNNRPIGLEQKAAKHSIVQINQLVIIVQVIYLLYGFSQSKVRSSIASLVHVIFGQTSNWNTPSWALKNDDGHYSPFSEPKRTYIMKIVAAQCNTYDIKRAQGHRHKRTECTRQHNISCDSFSASVVLFIPFLTCHAVIRFVSFPDAYVHLCWQNAVYEAQ